VEVDRSLGGSGSLELDHRWKMFLHLQQTTGDYAGEEAVADMAAVAGMWVHYYSD
jgi:hypothetical protein